VLVGLEAEAGTAAADFVKAMRGRGQ